MAEVTLTANPAAAGAISTETIIPSEGKLQGHVALIASVNLNADGVATGIRTVEGQFFPIVKSVREAANAKETIKQGSYAIVNASPVRTQRTNRETGKLEPCQPYIVNEVTAVFTDMVTLGAALAKPKVVADNLKKVVDTMVAKANQNFNAEDIAAKAIADNLI